VFERWITPGDATLDLLRAAGLNEVGARCPSVWLDSPHISPDLGGKRLELLKDVVPGLSRVAVLWNPDTRGAVLDYKESEAAASSLHPKLQSVEVSRPGDLDRALSSVTSEHAPAMPLLPGNPVTFSRRDEIAGFAQRNRLPSMYGLNEYVEARRQWRPADETRFPTGVRIDDHPRPPD
jgi:hypothetical protein